MLSSALQQGKTSQTETAMKKLYGKEKVAELMQDLRAGGEGSTEPDAGWFDLFSKRYWKGTSISPLHLLYFSIYNEQLVLVLFTMHTIYSPLVMQ